MIELPARERLIVALDVDTPDEAMEIVRLLGDSVEFYKVGWQLFMRTHFSVIKQLADSQKKVFLDLKIEDIEATIESAMRNTPDGVEFVELMTLKGASKAVAAAQSGSRSRKTTVEGLGHVPKFLMLTELSSLDDDDMKELYGPDATIERVVEFKARKALEAACDGLIASGESIKMLRDKFGEKFLIVAPGIRPPGEDVNEHKRALTPYQAISYGADYLVVGRPIRTADDPKGRAEAIVKDIERGLAERNRLIDSRAGQPNEFKQSRNVAAGAR